MRTTLFALICLLSVTVQAQDWTRFHGPNGSGVSEAKGIPTKFSAKDFNWRVKLPGTGHSSPVIWKDKIFLLCSDRKTAERTFVCLNAVDGKIAWKREYETEVHRLHTLSSFASCTPTVDKDRVYVAWSDPKKITLIAYRHDGEIAWQKDLGEWQSRHGFGTSPMIYKDLLIISLSQRKGRRQQGGPKSYVMAFNRKTGKEKWRVERRSNSVSYSTPCIYTPKGGKPQLICCNTGDGMYSLNPENGKENWALPVFRMRTVSSPIVVDGMLFGSTGSGRGGNYVVAVKPGDKPKQAYRVATQAPYVPTSCSKGNLVFLWSDGGVATCIDAKTGKRHWRKRIGGNFYGSPIRINNAVYNVSKTGLVVAIAASKEYKLLGKSDLKEISNSTMAVSGGRLYIRTLSHLISVGSPAAE